MTDNEEIQHQLTIGHLENAGIPASFVENVDLANKGAQRAILNSSTKEEIISVLPEHGGEEI